MTPLGLIKDLCAGRATSGSACPRPTARSALAGIPVEEHARELELILSGKAPGTLPIVIFVAEDKEGSLVGFLECGLRSHAESCNPSRAAGYVEGWYVVDGHRRRGIGKSLLAAAEEWARGQGCMEMASDALIDNVLSQNVHQRLGFEVVERSVHFRKALR